MRDQWKKQDRPSPPCPTCGTELYDQFWGNGGWAKADKTTNELHGERDCIRVLKTKLVDNLDAARLAVKWVVDHEHRAHEYDRPYAVLALDHIEEALRILRRDLML